MNVSPWTHIGDAMGELPRLLLHSIFLPGRRRRAAADQAPGDGQAPAAEASPPAARRAGGRKRARADAGHATGSVVLIGGTTLSDEIILEMIRLAGGREARIVILPTASLDFTRSGERYARGFRRFGAARVQVLNLVTRLRAADQEQAARLKEADLVFLGGGDASLVLEVLRNTPVHAALLEAYQAGATIAGIGAGAAVLGSMVTAPGAEQPAFVPGLGLAPLVLVEQRLLQLGRPGRVFYALAERGAAGGDMAPPAGIGIDDGAALIFRQGEGRVIGAGMAIVTSGDHARTEPVPSAPGLLVHVLPGGYRYDFKSGRPLPPHPEAPSLLEAR